MRTLSVLLLAVACGTASPHPLAKLSTADEPELARSADATIHREDPDKGPQAAVALAKDHGGWVAAMTADHVALRIPDAHLDAVLAGLATLGEVAERRVRAA